ncbi:MAG: histone H1 [Bacteroidota bacterium]
MENFQKLKELILSAETDATAFFEKGNKAAGTRLRNALQQTKVLAQELRAEVTAKKNSGK